MGKQGLLQSRENAGDSNQGVSKSMLKVEAKSLRGGGGKGGGCESENNASQIKSICYHFWKRESPYCGFYMLLLDRTTSLARCI